MTFDPDTLDNTSLLALDPASLADDDERQDLVEALNEGQLAGTLGSETDPDPVGVAQTDQPDINPPPSLDPTPVTTGTSPNGSGWVITFDDDGAVRTTDTGGL